MPQESCCSAELQRGMRLPTHHWNTTNSSRFLRRMTEVNQISQETYEAISLSARYFDKSYQSDKLSLPCTGTNKFLLEVTSRYICRYQTSSMKCMLECLRHFVTLSVESLTSAGYHMFPSPTTYLSHQVQVHELARFS